MEVGRSQAGTEARTEYSRHKKPPVQVSWGKETGVARAERASGSRWEFRPAGWTVEVTFLISANLSFLTYKTEQ